MTDIPYIKDFFYQHGYKYIDLIGEGSFATVFLCHCLKYNNLFAIKRVLKDEVVDHEIKSLISLIHPYIVKLYNTFSDENHQYLVMEYCPNGTLKQKSNLDYNKFIFYAKQILEVIEYCHSQNIAHRDIKPDNIFIDQYNHIKLGDFGLSHQFENEKYTNKKCGSLIYCAPEILEAGEVDPFKTDIWALGITFFYMITGTFPYPNCSNEKLRMLISTCQLNFSEFNIDPSIKSLIMKMTSKNVLFRPTAQKLLKLPIFNPLVQTKFSRRFSPNSKNFYKSKFSSSISLALASFATGSHDVISTDDTNTDNTNNEIEIENESDNGKRYKISKIHSLRSCDFFLNVSKNNHHHFTKYD